MRKDCTSESYSKKDWLTVREALGIINKKSKFLISDKHILRSATAYKKYKNHQHIKLASKKAISLYYYSSQLIQAEVIDVGDDIERRVNDIRFSGFIPISNRYIELIQNTGLAVLKEFFIHPDDYLVAPEKP